MTAPAGLRRRGRTTLVLVLLLSGCGPGTVDTAEEVVAAAIERHGGSRFDHVSIRWRFRGVPFGLDRDNGRFRYLRTMLDEQEIDMVHVVDNEGTWLELNGMRREVDFSERANVESDIAATVYLGFLPFRLDDAAVRLADLGVSEIEGRTYRKIEVTFDEEDGGRGWENRFVYWFLDGEWTLDYFAYAEPTDPPPTRFRRAVNRREIGGLLIQDYENYTVDETEAGSPAFDIADYDLAFEAGQTRLVSMVEFDDVQVGDTPVFPEP